MTALEVLGYTIATFGPLSSAIAFWRLSDRVQASWMMHLLFVPVAFLIYKLGEQLVYYAAGVPDGDSVEGYMLLPALSLFVLTTVSYLSVLASRALTRFWRQRNAR